MVAKLLADAGLAPEAGLGAALGAVLCGSQQAAAGGGGGGASVVTLPEKREALVTVLAALARQRPLLLCVEE